MATARGRPVDRAAAPARRGWLRLGVSRWSPSAWGAIAVTATFIAITCWWLSQDSTVPSADPASHLNEIVGIRELVVGLDPIGLLERPAVYPPVVYLVGVLGTLLRPASVGAPILAANLVFVTMLALGCYVTGRIAYGRAVGFLAVVFALGSPLLIEQFHVFMLDAPM